MKHRVKFLWGCIHPPIKGIITWQGQCKDILVQVTSLISAYTVTWVGMALEEAYTPVGRHFGDGCNIEIFQAKWILVIPSYVFGEMKYDGSIYHCRKYIVPLIVQVLKKKTGYLRFRMTEPYAILTYSETSKGVKWFQSKWKFVRSHPTCIILKSFHLKPLTVHNSEIIL